MSTSTTLLIAFGVSVVSAVSVAFYSLGVLLRRTAPHRVWTPPKARPAAPRPVKRKKRSSMPAIIQSYQTPPTALAPAPQPAYVNPPHPPPAPPVRAAKGSVPPPLPPQRAPQKPRPSFDEAQTPHEPRYKVIRSSRPKMSR